MSGFAEEFLQAMAAPESLRSLRQQKARLERERRLRFLEYLNQEEAARLRREIKDLGEEPCA